MHNKARAALTSLGIVLGVAILFGVLVSSATTNAGVDQLFEDFTGRADVLVSPVGAFDATMPAVTLRGLRRLPSVDAAAGGYGFPATLLDAQDPASPAPISLRGVVLQEDMKIQNYALVSGGGRFFEPGAAEVVLTERLAERRGIGLGDQITISTPTEPARLTVVGILTDTGAARRSEGRIAFTSLQTAQELGGVGDELTGAALLLTEGTVVQEWIQTHEGDLGPGYDFTDAASTGSGFRDFLSVLQSFFAFFAAIALFVGAFLIYLTLSMAIVERTRIYGTMRALGTTRAQIARVVLSEAAVLGLVSTAVGLLLGLLAARGLLVLIGQLFDIQSADLTIPGGAVAVSVVLGVGVTILASLAPALRAGHLAPVLAMKGDHTSEVRPGRGWKTGIALVSAGLLVRAGGGGNAAISGSSTIALLFGTVLVVPVLLGPLAAVLGRVTGRISPGVGQIAVLHLVKEKSRSAYTLGLIMVVMAMLLAIGGVNASVTRSISDVVDRQYGADLTLRGGGPLDPRLGETLAALPGVDRVTGVRFGTAQIPEAPEGADRAQMTIVQPESYFQIAGFSWVDGDDASAQQALSEGGSVLVSDTMSRSVGASRSDTVVLNTAAGPAPFTVAGVYVSFEGPPIVTLGLKDGVEKFAADRPSVFLLSFAEGAEAADVVETVRGQVAGPAGLTMQTAAEQKDEITDEIGRYFRIVYAILLFAAVVGLLGLANTLAMSVIRRWREIGILRAIGVTRNQVAGMVLVESATMGLVAFVLSIPLGSVLSVLIVRDTSSAFGLTMPYLYPASWVPLLAVFGTLVAVLAAIAPGRRAARLEVVEALQYE